MAATTYKEFHSGDTWYRLEFSRYPKTNNVKIVACADTAPRKVTITENMIRLVKKAADVAIDTSTHRFAAINSEYSDLLFELLAHQVVVPPVIDMRKSKDETVLLCAFHDEFELPDDVPIPKAPPHLSQEPEPDLEGIKMRETTGPQDFVNQLTAELKVSAIDQLCKSGRARIQCRDFPDGNELAIIIYLDDKPLIGSSLKGTTVDGGHGMLCHTTAEPKQLATMIQGSTRAKGYE